MSFNIQYIGSHSSQEEQIQPNVIANENNFLLLSEHMYPTVITGIDLNRITSGCI